MQPPNLCQVASDDNIVCIMVEVMIVRERVTFSYI